MKLVVLCSEDDKKVRYLFLPVTEIVNISVLTA